MLRIAGTRVVFPRTRAATRKHGQVLPSRREKRIWLVCGSVALHLEWLPWEGYAVIGRAKWLGRDVGTVEVLDRPGWSDGMKRRVVKGSDLILPLLSRETATLKKLPDLVAFLAECSYDDMTMRTPGYFTLRNRLHCYELTLYDPDAGVRLALRAQTLDDVLRLANEAVTAEGLPWEIDNYLQEQLTKKTKKKR